MTPSRLFGYSSDGNTIVVGDGNEILVHDGGDESPRFRHTLDAPIFAVAATPNAAVALDEKGGLSCFEPTKGERIKTLESGGSPAAFAAHANGSIAVALDVAIVIFDREGEKRGFDIAGVTALAFSDDGEQLAAGTKDGDVRVLSVQSGESIGESKLGEPIRSVAWNAGGFWIAAGGERVFRIEKEGKPHEQLTRASGMSPDCLACSPDGSLIGLRLDAATVVLLAYPSKNTAATIQYIDRKAVGIAFGPRPYVGIGIDQGDGNKINLSTKAVHRTDTHPGREHHRWMLSVAIEKTALPDAYGGSPAAFATARGSEPPSSSNASKSKQTPSNDNSPIQTILGFVLVGIGLVILLVTQCG